MRDTTVFLRIDRKDPATRPPAERVMDYRDVAIPRGRALSEEQASRCVNCAVPFCHWTCPLGNYIPDWNDRMADGQWEEALRLLERTNTLPEITGRICPALCESGCVLEISEGAVTIRENELAVIEHGFQAGFIYPRPPCRRTGRSVAVVGSGPAGLACADQINKAGHRVVVFERDAKPGGILRYGIPDFKLEKWVIDRRLDIWKAEGIEFVSGADVGSALPVSKLRKEFDAVCLAAGSRLPRDLKIEGRTLRGIHFAMDYLTRSNRRVAGEPLPAGQIIDAEGKKVVVIGGGDTGADCVGTAHRQGARQVVQIELLARPPEKRGPRDRWPRYPTLLKTSTSHEEGGLREWSVLTKRFAGEGGAVKKLLCIRTDTSQRDEKGNLLIREIPGTEFEIEADLVLLAMGFVSAEPEGLLKEIGISLGPRGSVQTDSQHLTAVPGVFSAGDMRRGQSLVGRAISEGRKAAHYIDRFLMGRSDLPFM